MELSYDDIEKYLLKIFTGQEFFYINNGNQDVLINFRHPDNITKIKSNIIYDKYFDKALSEGILSTKDLEDLIIKRGIFTLQDQERIDKLKDQLHAQKILLSKTTKVRANQERIKDVIFKLNIELKEVVYKKQSKLMMSAENKAEEERSSFLCWSCTYNENNELFWSSYEEFLNESNSTLKNDIFIKFIRFNNGIPIDAVRYIARNNLWRIRYVNSQKVSESLFGVSTSDYTTDMLHLAYWSNYYQNIYEMLPEDRPSESIIDDDEALDAYMTSYYDDRSKEDAARRSKRKTRGQMSAFDSEEVIITQTNELYEDIKYDKPREAQRIKNRMDIKKKARSGSGK
jgi:hypothetical protein